MIRFLWVLAALMISAAGLAGYAGLLAPSLHEETRGPYHYLYRPVSNDPTDRQLAAQELGQLLASLQVDQRWRLSVEHTDGTAETGFLIEDVTLSMALSDGTRTRTIDPNNMMVVSFPDRISYASTIARFRTDRMLNQRRAAAGYLDTEIMTLYRDDQITFLQPIIQP